MIPDLVVDAKALLGEGPVWHPNENKLYWVDIDGGAIHCHDPQGDPDTVYPVGGKVGVAVPCQTGEFVIATDTGFHMVDLVTGRRKAIADPESDLPNHRFNDGKCDAAGRFWAGTFDMTRQPHAGSLYVLEPNGSVRRMLDHVSISNGLEWSLDNRTMYYIDTPTLQVSAFDFDLLTGTISNRRIVIEFPDGVGRPDGMTVDTEDMLWIAHWDGGRISRWDPRTGRCLTEIPLPVDRVTSCAFGGPDLATLYVTTARTGLDAQRLEQQPSAGGLFAVEPGVTGRPANMFGTSGRGQP